jgi:hypothetical protein
MWPVTTAPDYSPTLQNSFGPASFPGGCLLVGNLSVKPGGVNYWGRSEDAIKRNPLSPVYSQRRDGVATSKQKKN